ncbi:lipoprotein [Leptospira andrefontaineae]|uniref:Lipoprotein n=1 Tax=Leptospira andrefontaineae TaxID=2484976 RepID=A0A4R9HAL8_9LEPT|nr:lipoprotein [Leptospira andrefontaineae]TGK43535.1 lipoprotein [Leptospira andrefontaineae]
MKNRILNHKFIIFHIATICSIVYLFPGCSILSSIGFDKFTNIRSADKPEKAKSQIMIGYIENRDLRFDPYRIKNFVSMLRFEIIRSGNAVIQSDDSVPSQEGSANKQGSSNPASSNPVAETDTNVQNAMQEMTKSLQPSAPAAKQEKSNKLLSESEIKGLSSFGFDYYLQGSFSLADNGNILDKKTATLVFIDVFDRTGKMVRTISYTSENKNFSDADHLKDICSNIADKLNKR